MFDCVCVCLFFFLLYLSLLSVVTSVGGRYIFFSIYRILYTIYCITCLKRTACSVLCCLYSYEQIHLRIIITIILQKKIKKSIPTCQVRSVVAVRSLSITEMSVSVTAMSNCNSIQTLFVSIANSQHGMFLSA